MTLKSSLAYFVTRSSLNFTKHPITRRAKPKICNARVFSDYDSYQKYFVHTLYVRGDKSKLNNYIHVFLLCISLTRVWNLITCIVTSLRVVVWGGGVFQVLLGPRVIDSINNTISLRVSYRKYGKDMLAISTLK